MLRSLARCLPVAALALTLAACGDDDPDDAAATTVAPDATAATSTPAETAAPDTTGTAPAGDTFPVTVEHALGTTTIEAEPTRVVTVGVTEQDFVLAVGVIPVGVTEWYGEQPYATWPWAQDELGDAKPEVLTTEDGLDYERIAALEPGPHHRHQRRASTRSPSACCRPSPRRSPTRRTRRCTSPAGTSRPA